MAEFKRRLWTVTKWAYTGQGESYEAGEFRVPENDLEADAIGSLIENKPSEPELHAPVLDFDFPCELLPSSTYGNNHLYINTPMSWENYEKLLGTLCEVGLIQEGFYRAAIKNKQTIVRKPGTHKDPPEPDPLYTIRLREIRDSIDGLFKTMGGKEEPVEESTDISF